MKQNYFQLFSVMLACCIASLFPFSVFAQAYVPVNDESLNSSFSDYASKFDNYANSMKQSLTDAPDSLRDVIAGYDPQGVATQSNGTDSTCKKRNALDKVFAYDDGSWGKATTTAKEMGFSLPDKIPEGGGYVQVNDSASIRCLLQELNGYQKTSLYVQFHTLLKQYIADAQQKELTNQLISQISAAKLNWAKGGVQVNNGGIMSSEPIYVTNVNNNIYNRNDRTITNIVSQTAANPGDTIGSLEVCDPIGAATNLAQTTQGLVADPETNTVASTRCPIGNGSSFSNTATFNNYLDDPNTPSGPGSIFGLGMQIDNPALSPITIKALTTDIAYQRVQTNTENYKFSLTSTGVQSTQKCSGAPDDLYCNPNFVENVTPGAQNVNLLLGALNSGDNLIATADKIDTGPGEGATNLSIKANTDSGGIAEYNPDALAKSTTAVNALIQELYDSIQYAYFDLNSDQIDWAHAALLNIYDEMSFDDSKPSVVVPSNQNPQTVPQK